MRTLQYKCEECNTLNDYALDGRCKTPDSVYIFCQNSKCQYFLNRRKMWLVNEDKPITKTPMIDETLKNRIIEESNIWYSIACDYFKIVNPLPLIIDFSLTGSVAGCAIGTHRLEYNPTLAQENESDFISKTIPHEIAHLIDVKVYGIVKSGKKIKHHGDGWKSVMRVFGLTPTRCHSYNIQNVGRRKYIYNCPCGNSFPVGLNLHKRIQNKTATHYCVACKTKLIDCTLDTGNNTD